MRPLIHPLIAGMLAGPVLAWATPDAGSILQQLEARPGGTLVAPPLKTPQVPTPPAVDLGGPVVRVNAFRVDGNTLLGSEKLQAALQGFTKRDLSLTQLQEAAWVIVQTYREAGWLAHAFVPAQEIEGGEVTLRVVEARLGQVRISYPDTAVPRSRIQAMAEAQLPAGELLNLRRVDRLLLLLEDLPGTTATASFVQGQTPGTTDLQVMIGSDKAWSGHVTLDNFGGLATGRDRLSAAFTFNNWVGLGDLMQLQAQHSQGSDYARVAWSVPVGVQGWRAGVHATAMRYHLVGSFANLQANGSAHTSGITISAPLIRQPERNLSWQLSTDHKHFDNRALSGASATEPTTVSKYRLDVVRSAFVGNWVDRLITSAQNTASLQASWGKVDLGGSPNATDDANAAHTGGAFRKINASYSREQVLNRHFSWTLQGAAQWANRNLDSSERLYLGGASGVRAYPSNEAGGSLGATASTGLRWRIDASTSLTAFADWGRIRVHKNNLSATGQILSDPNTQTLQGHGLSLVWQNPQGYELAATWSRRQGRNPAAHPSTGADSDGTRTLNRFWLSASMNF